MAQWVVAQSDSVQADSLMLYDAPNIDAHHGGLKDVLPREQTVAQRNIRGQTEAQSDAQAMPFASAQMAEEVLRGGLRLGFVNLRRVLVESPQIVRMGELLEKEFSEAKASLLATERTLVAMQAQLAQMPRDEAYSAFEKQVIAKQREYERQEAALRDSYSLRRNEETAKLQTLVVEEIIRLAKAQHFDVILNDTGVIYVGEAADLTPEVMARLKALNAQEREAVE